MTNYEETRKKGFICRNLEKIVAPVVLAGALAFGGGKAVAQESNSQQQMQQAYQQAVQELSAPVQTSEEGREEKLEEEIEKISAKLHFDSLYDNVGLNTNERLKLSFSDLAVVLSHQHTPFQNRYGVDISNDVFRVHGGYGKTETGVETYRALGILYFDGAFLGAKYLDLSNGEHISMHAGVPFGDSLEARVFAGDTGVSAVGFLKNKDSTFALGGGSDFDGNWDANISYADEHVLSWLRGGNVMPLDARFFFGKINPRQNLYVFNTMGSGNNERDDFGELDDPALPFSIGSNPRTLTDYFGGAGVWLGPEAGDAAVNLRFQEGNRAIAEMSYRWTDNLTTMHGIRAEVVPDSFADVERVGLQNQIHYSLGSLLGIDPNKGDISLQFNTWIDTTGNFEYSGGIGGEIRF